MSLLSLEFSGFALRILWLVNLIDEGCLAKVDF